MTKTCIICGEEFNPYTEEKRRVGGRITECPDCSDETAVKYIGLQSADGKQAQATILQFGSERDKNKYLDFWKNNSGYHKGKSGSQIGKHLSTTPNIKFKTVVGFCPTNHKGKS